MIVPGLPDNKSINENKLSTLATVKTEFRMEPYVTIMPFTKRRAFAKLRTSTHALEVETQRYIQPKPDRELRICKLCDSGQVEDEHHHLLNCKFFKQIRKLPFEINNSADCFKHIFGCYNGHPATTRIICNFATALSDLRYELKLCQPQPSARPTVTRFAGGGGRVIVPPERLTHHH